MSAPTFVVRLTRDGVDVIEPVVIPRVDYDRLRATTLMEFPTRGRNAALRVELVTPGRVYRLSVERATSGRRSRGAGR